MLTLIRYFLDVALFQRGPQDAPLGRFALTLAVALYIGIEALALLMVRPQISGLLHLVADVLLSLGFVYAILAWRGVRERFMQTATALFGAQAIVNIVLIGLLPLPGAVETLGLGLFFWSIGITGVILRHSAKLELPIALLLAFGLTLVGALIIGGLSGAH